MFQFIHVKIRETGGKKQYSRMLSVSCTYVRKIIVFLFLLIYNYIIFPDLTGLRNSIYFIGPDLALKSQFSPMCHRNLLLHSI